MVPLDTSAEKGLSVSGRVHELPHEEPLGVFSGLGLKGRHCARGWVPFFLKVVLMRTGTKPRLLKCVYTTQPIECDFNGLFPQYTVPLEICNTTDGAPSISTMVSTQK